MITFKNCYILSKTLALSKMGKASVLLNEPIQVGFAILDISKVIVMEHLGRLLNEDPDLIVVYTATDSLKTYNEKNIYKIANNLIDCYDMSNFKGQTTIPIIKGEKKMRVFKFESGTNPVEELTSLAPKTYGQLHANDFSQIKIKGANLGFQNKIDHKDFMNAIITNKPRTLEQLIITSKTFYMSMDNTNKEVIPVSTNKRQFFDGLSTSFAWGYKGEKYQELKYLKNMIYHQKNKYSGF